MDAFASPVRQVAETVARRLEASGMSKYELSRRTGIPRSTLYRKLDGMRAFDVYELYVISRELGVPYTDLVAVDGALAS